MNVPAANPTPYAPWAYRLATALVCGLVPASGGRVRFDGADLTNRHYRDVVKAGLIQVPEGRRIFPNLSVRENLELGAFARARERRAANLERVFATFPRLAERVAQKAGTMTPVFPRATFRPSVLTQAPGPQ